MNKLYTTIVAIGFSISMSSCFFFDTKEQNNNNRDEENNETTLHDRNKIDDSNGPIAIDFSLNDIKGNEVSLMDIVSGSEITIVDFWASWCQPCMREMPNLVRLYENYSDDGLAILGVSLDNDKKAWEHAVETMGMKWVQVSDLKGWDNHAARLYQVESIPHTIILDKNGHILAEDLRGHELEEFISDYIE